MASSLDANGISYLEPRRWEAGVGYRYLHADQVFIGSEYRPEFEEAKTNPDITVHSIDLNVTFQATPRFSLTLEVPFSYGEVTVISNRIHMAAGGLGDLRLIGNTWLLDPVRHATGNISLGIGVKAPTGDDKATDHIPINGERTLRPVDTAIQPGDGGWGVLLEMRAFQQIWERTYFYAAGFYLMNPREKNNTEFFADPNVRLSVPDQYMGQVGVSYTVWPKYGLAMSLGGRIDGMPVRDLIGGGDDGFRRPGFTIYVDPGVTWAYGKNSFSVSTPVAVERHRERSIRDLMDSERTGRAVRGAGGLAEFLVIASYSRRF